MGVLGSRLAMTDEAARIDEGSDRSDRIAGQYVIIYNEGPAVVDLGGADVVSGEGYELSVDSETQPLTLGDADSIFGVCPVGEVATVHVLQVGI